MNFKRPIRNFVIGVVRIDKIRHGMRIRTKMDIHGPKRISKYIKGM